MLGTLELCEQVRPRVLCNLGSLQPVQSAAHEFSVRNSSMLGEVPRMDDGVDVMEGRPRGAGLDPQLGLKYPAIHLQVLIAAGMRGCGQ